MILRREHDVCIVGSGFAGTFLGLRLVERGIDTAIVEAGGNLAPDTPPEGRTDLFPHVSRGDAAFPVDFNRTIAIGGTSRKWNGVVSRFLPSDFRSKTEFGLFEDWPIGYEDLDIYYDQAERALETCQGSHARGRGADRLPPLPGSDSLCLTPVSFSVRERGGGSVRLRDIEIPRFTASSRGTLLAECPATRILTAQNGKVTGVEVRGPAGTTGEIRARRVVLAAGIMETVRLLLVSDSPAFPRGVGNRRQLVGRYVHAHPRPRLHVSRLAPFTDTRGVFRSLRYCDELRRSGLASVCVDLNFLEQEPAVDVTLETEPAAANRIHLDPRRRDPWGRPVAVIDSAPTERDLRTRDSALALQKRLAAELLAGGQPFREAELKCFHPAGGCRMGRSADEAVVDSDGRVFGTDNLYVAGASVFPTSGAANPTLTIVALALRLGDHLAGPR